MISDKIGRQKVLILTTFVNFIATTHLAFCKSYWEAYVNRLVSGLFAGSTPVTKALIREISNDSNISKLYAVFAIGVGFANLLGPLLAMFSNPSKSVSFLSDSVFFKHYPYSLPLLLQYFLCSSLICLATLVSVVFLLKEPRRASKKNEESFWSLFHNRLYLLTVLSYWMVGFFQFGFRLVYSLICKSGEALGGFGIQLEYQVSFIQMVSGVFVMVLPPVLTPRLEKRFGLLKSIVGIAFCMVPLVVLLGLAPLMSLYLKILALFLIYGLENSLISIFIFYISICISNTVTSNVMATAVGLSQALVGISRFAGTSGFGVLYGWTVGPGISLGIDAKFTCFVMGFVPVVSALVIWLGVDLSVEKKKVMKDHETPLMDKEKENFRS